MSFNTAFRKRTICEVLREIYDLINHHNELITFDDTLNHMEQIRRKLEEALHMAKRMNKKLIEYKRDWDKDMNWEPNLDYKEDLARRSK